MADVPRFEVASVKPSRPVAGQGVLSGMVSDPSRFRGSFVTLADLVGKAYGVDVARISGGASWIPTERYDIVATLPQNAPQEQIPILLQTLLAERFGLTVRRDMKMSQVYALLAAKAGPKLKRSEAASSPPPAGQSAIFSTPGIVRANGGGLRLCRGKAKPIGISMERLADLLSSQTDPSVYTAIQEQLGLRLEPRSAPSEYLVIEHAARPTEN